jgi:hypothetical protein
VADRPGRRGLRQRYDDLQQRITDTQQRHADRLEQERKDKTDPDLPYWYRSLPRKSTLRWTIAIFFALALFVILRAGHHAPPKLTTSCRTPGLALSTSSVKHDGLVRWSATGPPNQEVVLAIGVTGFRTGVGPGRLTAIPDPGRTAKQVEQASALVHLSSGCTLSGTFSALVPPGRYQVRLFRVIRSGPSLTARAEAGRPLTVT